MDRTDIGQFPYNRGETPIFNFDIGDEDFLKVSSEVLWIKNLFFVSHCLVLCVMKSISLIFQTIPDLVTGLRDMANVVAEQTKVTGAYGAAFLDCPDCKF